MSMAGNTAPIAVTPAGVSVDNMVAETEIDAVTRRRFNGSLQIAMNAIFNYILENLDNDRFIYSPRDA